MAPVSPSQLAISTSGTGTMATITTDGITATLGVNTIGWPIASENGMTIVIANGAMTTVATSVGTSTDAVLGAMARVTVAVTTVISGATYCTG